MNCFLLMGRQFNRVKMCSNTRQTHCSQPVDFSEPRGRSLQSTGALPIVWASNMHLFLRSRSVCHLIIFSSKNFPVLLLLFLLINCVFFCYIIDIKTVALLTEVNPCVKRGKKPNNPAEYLQGLERILWLATRHFHQWIIINNQCNGNATSSLWHISKSILLIKIIFCKCPKESTHSRVK